MYVCMYSMRQKKNAKCLFLVKFLFCMYVCMYVCVCIVWVVVGRYICRSIVSKLNRYYMEIDVYMHAYIHIVYTYSMSVCLRLIYT